MAKEYWEICLYECTGRDIAFTQNHIMDTWVKYQYLYINNHETSFIKLTETYGDSFNGGNTVVPLF